MEDVSKRKQRGITLIALVITIIVLLILAGVTINLTIGERGIFTTAQDASKQYTVASERECLQQDVLEYQMQQVINGKEYKKIGETLYDKTAENSAIWNIIQEKGSEKNVYGTGWNYIEKGSNIANYGNAKYNWLVNYDTEEIIKLEDESYNHLNGSSSIAVKDGLIFSYDSAYVNADKESFGEHSKLYSFDIDKYPDIESRKKAPVGYDRVEVEDVSEFIDENTHALKFNGNNYIEIENEAGFDFSNGFTFIYYGSYDGQTVAIESDGMAGLLTTWNQNVNALGSFRSAYSNGDLFISFNTSWWNTPCGTFGGTNEGEYHAESIHLDSFTNDKFLIAIVATPNGEKVTHDIFCFDNEGTQNIFNGELEPLYYKQFVDESKGMNCIDIGRYQNRSSVNWCYLMGTCYCTMLYNRGLDETEIMNVYNELVTMHENN